VADILLSNDDLTVFGGPETISLDLDIGPQGDRGSIIVGSNGNPQDANVNAALQLQPRYLPPAPGFDFPDGINALDIAIDYNPASSTYKTVFQRVATPTGTQWTKLIDLKTNFYSSTKTVTAADGKLTIPPINLTDIYFFQDNTTVDSSNFSVQYSISSPDSGGPLATTLVVKELNTSSGFLALPLEIKGVEYDGTDWVPITGTKNVHLFITVV
jgi:hypothetical protein